MATDKYELPGGIGALAGLITTGTSIFGWEPDRDGIPEVVTRAHERLGSTGCIAIARLAREADPVPKFEAAARLVEWGIGHYWGREVRTGRFGPGQPEWEAKADLMRRCFYEVVQRSTSGLGWGTEAPGTGVPWADCIDWSDAAVRAEVAGAVVFTVSVQKITGKPDVTEVDMFVSGGEDWRESGE